MSGTGINRPADAGMARTNHLNHGGFQLAHGHPAAKIGQGIMIDHAHSIVIGETAVVGNNVSMLHSVTLGGTGKEEEDRHPKIGDGVLIGAGAKVLGNIKVGECSRIAAGSVVLEEVPPCKTVAGVPARIVGEAGCSQPSVSMDQTQL